MGKWGCNPVFSDVYLKTFSLMDYLFPESGRMFLKDIDFYYGTALKMCLLKSLNCFSNFFLKVYLYIYM